MSCENEGSENVGPKKYGQDEVGISVAMEMDQSRNLMSK